MVNEDCFQSVSVPLIAKVLEGYKELLINSVIHRDLKSENIMIHEDNYKIGDFGLAKRYKNPKTGQHIPYKSH